MPDFSEYFVRETYRIISASYYKIMNCLTDRMQNEFINKIADNWASPDAYKFFREQVKPRMDDLIIYFRDRFYWIVDNFNDAQISWWYNDPDTYGTRNGFSYMDDEERRINVDFIKKDFDGTIAMDVDNINDALNSFNGIIDSINGYLDDTQREINTNCFMWNDSYDNSCSFIGQMRNILYDDSTSIISVIKNKVYNDRDSYIRAAERNRESFELSEE